MITVDPISLGSPEELSHLSHDHLRRLLKAVVHQQQDLVGRIWRSSDLPAPETEAIGAFDDRLEIAEGERAFMLLQQAIQLKKQREPEAETPVRVAPGGRPI